MTKATPLREALRNRLREIRLELGLTQEEFARWVSHQGLTWNRHTVKNIEEGTRDISLSEFFPLVYLLPVQFEELFPEDMVLELDGGRHVRGGAELRALLEPQQDATVTPKTVRLGVAAEEDRALPITPVLGSEEPTLADGKAAQALQTSVALVRGASQRLWGRDLASERDHRVQAKLESREVSARSLQALRGHVTRELLNELKPHIKPKRRTKKGSKR